MHFRAVIKDQQLMKEFLNSISVISKLTKTCIMVISQEHIIFVSNEETTSAAPFVWTNIDIESYFNSYNIKGLNDEHNKILLRINPIDFARSLIVLKNSAVCCKIKLTNKLFPCLTVDIEMSNNTIQNRRVIHDVPIDIVPLCDWELYKLPNIPKSDIVLTLPSLRYVRTLVDKIKNISPSITIYGTNEGELIIVAETESAKICSRHQNLKIDNDGNNNYFEASCPINSKKTATFLTSLQTGAINNSELSCGIVHERLVLMTIKIGIGSIMHCVISAICV